MSDCRITTPVMEAFQLGMAKEALSTIAGLGRRILSRGGRHAAQAGFGAGAGLGLGAGGLLGGLSGAQEGYSRASDAGATTGQALVSGLGGALSGATSGALKGALLGGAGGAVAGLSAPLRATMATRKLTSMGGPLGGLSRFGQRQVHGFTGFKPGGSARSIETIGGGASAARGALEAARKGGEPKALARAEKALSSAENAQQMGLTSLPGIARSIGTHGALPTLKAGLREQWHSLPSWQKALVFGAPVASAGAAAMGPAEGRGEGIGRSLGMLGYSLAPLPLGASIALGAGLEGAGGAIGRGVDALRKKKEPSLPTVSEPEDAGLGQVEHVYGTGYGGESL